MEKFRIRPERGGTNLLIEFCGDHRSENYPDITMLLVDALGAEVQGHPISVETMIATDHYISSWSYKNGIYETDDDIWGYFITVPDGSLKVIANLEHALTNSGHFVKVDACV